MAESFKLEIKGLNETISALNYLQQSVQFGIQDDFKAIGAEWVAVSQRDAPVDRGRLRASVSKVDGYLALEIVAQLSYAPFQEFGTKGNFKAPAILGNYPAQFKGPYGISDVDPLVALTAWVKRKGLVQKYQVPLKKKTYGKGGSYKTKADAARNIAFLIYRKIRRDGVKPHPFLFSAPDGSDRVTFFVNKLRANIKAQLEKLL